MTRDATYEGMRPGDAEWWIANLDTPPLLVIRCGRGEPRCTSAMGEVKRDGDRFMAMSQNPRGEVETDWTPLAAPTAEELAAEIAEDDAQVLKYIGAPGAGRKVYKRITLPREVAPVQYLAYYVCRTHGEIEVDPADLERCARDTPKPKTTYWSAE